ncbi:MAG: hypothetical protein ABDH16_02405 [Thermodesulfovibrionaceae bacterium]
MPVMLTKVNRKITVNFKQIDNDLTKVKTQNILSIVSDALKKAYMEVNNGANGSNQKSVGNNGQGQQYVCNSDDYVSTYDGLR